MMGKSVDMTTVVTSGCYISLRTCTGLDKCGYVYRYLLFNFFVCCSVHLLYGLVPMHVIAKYKNVSLSEHYDVASISDIYLSR